MQKTIMCFGDSNTWGASPHTGERYDRQTRWPCVMQQELGEDVHVIEEGLRGRNTVWDDPVGNPGKNGLEILVPLIHSHMPLDLLIILLGTNDFKSRFNVSALDISWSIGRLVKTARDSGNPFLGEVPEVLVVCPPPLGDLRGRPFQDTLIGAEEKSRQLPSVLRTFCEENRIRFFNSGDVVQSSEADGVHWEPEEHIKLGRALAPVVRNIMQGSTYRSMKE